MTRFRPCIDLHAGEVKQIVGGTLDSSSEALKTNYVSQHPADYYARLYKDNQLLGAHVIMLGPGNNKAAKEALQAWPGGLQVGGGITDKNAREWIEEGAERVSFQRLLKEPQTHKNLGHHHILSFSGGQVQSAKVGCRAQSTGRRQEQTSHRFKLSPSRGELVCCHEQVADHHRYGSQFRYILPTSISEVDTKMVSESIKALEPYCSEFLIHAADNEGLQKGIDEKLVERLAEWCSIPVTYAGGGRNLDDLELVKSLSGGKIDLTIGSALDCFGGSGVKFDDCVEWNRKQEV